MFAGLHPSIILPMGSILACLPLVWLMLRRRSRMRKFAKQLPDALELISTTRTLRYRQRVSNGSVQNTRATPASSPISTTPK